MTIFIWIKFRSPFTFRTIYIGGITQTLKGLWLPKIKVSRWTCQNIKNGFAQPTQDEAINILVRGYYEYVGKQNSWTTEEVEKRLSKAYRLLEAEEQKRLALEQKRLALEAENEARKQRQRERSRANPVTVKVILCLRYFTLRCITFSDKTTYKVHFKQVKGWREIRNAMKQLKIGHNNQYKWRFDTMDAALNFLSLIRTQVEINTNSSLCQNWDEPPHFSHPMCGEVEFGGGLDTERFTQN